MEEVNKLSEQLNYDNTSVDLNKDFLHNENLWDYDEEEWDCE